MTCIVGLVENNHVFIGGDSAGVADYDISIRADQKVFKNGEFIFGFTTSFRMGQLLRYSLKPPRRHPDDDVFKFMVTDFMDSVRECLKSGGFAEKKNESEFGGTFLVGYRGRLFNIYDDYQVGEDVLGFSAVGCGESYAKGAMYVTPNLKPKDRILKALESAQKFSAGVCAPFHIEDLKCD